MLRAFRSSSRPPESEWTPLLRGAGHRGLARNRHRIYEPEYSGPVESGANCDSNPCSEGRSYGDPKAYISAHCPNYCPDHDPNSGSQGHSPAYVVASLRPLLFLIRARIFHVYRSLRLTQALYFDVSQEGPPSSAQKIGKKTSSRVRELLGFDHTAGDARMSVKARNACCLPPSELTHP